MSKHDNHRRCEGKRAETGSRYENPDLGVECNATHVARGRHKWKRITAQKDLVRRGRRSLIVPGTLALMQPATYADDVSIVTAANSERWDLDQETETCTQVVISLHIRGSSVRMTSPELWHSFPSFGRELVDP